ncbi:embryonic polyadenylate-binding protein 2 [Oryx dammah]|uniref:embryonic polyadenylate-binding protein 2 n=1 Tax=Oryx dammah TaxID=59534 RepID=UPI001A9BECEA|nr:embryonic polyadenylate-binding protein 2 [Oryx dammah]
MWPFLSRALFPPPTEAWLQRASSDPEAQGWGAWSPAEKTHLGPGAGGEEEETEKAEEDDEEDAGFLLPLLEREGLAECPVPDQVTTEQNAWGKPVGSWEPGEPGAWGWGIDCCSSASRGQRATVPHLEEGIGTPATHKLERPLCVGVYKRGFLHGSLGAVPPRGSAWAMCWQELEAIKLKLWAMEQAQGLEPPRVQGLDEGEEAAGALLARQLLSPKTDSPLEKAEADHRSVYVGNVDYGGTAQELEAYFNHCGEIHRVTILCDKFSGHPKGYAYIEFATESSAQAAVELDKSIFRGRVIKVLPKRTNLPGISSTDRGGLRGHPGAKVGSFPHSGLQGGARFRPRGRSRWAGPWEGGDAEESHRGFLRIEVRTGF